MVSYFAASEFNNEFGKFNLIRLSDLLPLSYDKEVVEQLYKTQVENISFDEDSYGKYKDDSCEYMSQFYKSEGLKTSDYSLKFLDKEVVLRYRGTDMGYIFSKCSTLISLNYLILMLMMKYNFFSCYSSLTSLIYQIVTLIM